METRRPNLGFAVIDEDRYLVRGNLKSCGFAKILDFMTVYDNIVTRGVTRCILNLLYCMSSADGITS